MNETKKKNYILLRNQINVIKNNLYDLDSKYKKVNNSLKNNIVIDRKTIGTDELSVLENNTNSVLYQINNVLLPIINKNINS